MGKLVVGIDGGLDGAFALVAEGESYNQLIDYWDMPIFEERKKTLRGPKKGKIKKKRYFDHVSMFCILAEKLKPLRQYYHIKSAVEIAHSMPKQGLSSTFKIGEGFGLIKMLVTSLGMECNLIKAVDWQKYEFDDVDGKDTKDNSTQKALRLFPNIILTKPRNNVTLICKNFTPPKPSKSKGKTLALDGRADAALIADYKLKHWNKK
jgi:hypothetical protein